MAESSRIDELKRRVQSDPASIAFAALAEEYRRAGLFEEAIATCTTGLVRHPSYLSAHVTLGRALIEVRRFDEARQELEQVLKMAPENLAAIRGLAEIHGRGRETAHYAAMDEGAAEADVAPADASPIEDGSRQEPDAMTPEEIVTAPQPATTAPPADAEPPPGLVGLEQFLVAIQRARSDRAAHR